MQEKEKRRLSLQRWQRFARGLTKGGLCSVGVGFCVLLLSLSSPVLYGLGTFIAVFGICTFIASLLIDRWAWRKFLSEPHFTTREGFNGSEIKKNPAKISVPLFWSKSKTPIQVEQEARAVTAAVTQISADLIAGRLNPADIEKRLSRVKLQPKQWQSLWLSLELGKDCEPEKERLDEYKKIADLLIRLQG